MVAIILSSILSFAVELSLYIPKKHEEFLNVSLLTRDVNIIKTS
jgi:hypothetical protein